METRRLGQIFKRIAKSQSPTPTPPVKCSSSVGRPALHTDQCKRDNTAEVSGDVGKRHKWENTQESGKHIEMVCPLKNKPECPTCESNGQKSVLRRPWGDGGPPPEFCEEIRAQSGGRTGRQVHTYQFSAPRSLVLQMWQLQIRPIDAPQPVVTRLLHFQLRVSWC